MNDRDENGKFMADPSWMRQHLSLREKLETVLSAGPNVNLPISEIQWVAKVVKAKPVWARDIILKHGG